MSRRRQLSDEEQALWSGFARSIKPLRGKRDSGRPAVAADKADKPPPRAAISREAQPQPAPRAKTQPAKTPPLAPLGRRLKQRVARGREPIEARIDLHGMTQMQAHAALLRFLQRAQDDDARIALVVTGKGTGAAAATRDSTNERGVLKRQVPIWLSLPEFRSLIVGFEEAHIGHGGQGALYVRLRRGARRG
jgi:DNA-nicking Smr family endonuclease